ncbi:MAG: hypothetical protein Q8P13_02385 [bacterium]|nr:hypothetical protein [bacterium]
MDQEETRGCRITLPLGEVDPSVNKGALEAGTKIFNLSGLSNELHRINFYEDRYPPAEATTVYQLYFTLLGGSFWLKIAFASDSSFSYLFSRREGRIARMESGIENLPYNWDAHVSLTLQTLRTVLLAQISVKAEEARKKRSEADNVEQEAVTLEFRARQIIAPPLDGVRLVD